MEENVFYHVVTERPMYVGQIIRFDDDNCSGVYRRVTDKLELIRDIYANPSKYENADLDHHTKVALRELALEKVRNENYPEYPSRLKSLYVSKSLEDAEMWADSFIAGGRDVYQIVKVRNNGMQFTGNAYNCFEGSINQEENVRRAHNYWKNEPSSDGLVLETIIDGDIEVIQIVISFELPKVK